MLGSSNDPQQAHMIQLKVPEQQPDDKSYLASISCDSDSQEATIELNMVTETMEEEQRKSLVEPLPIFTGEIRGNEPTVYGKTFGRFPTSQTKSKGHESEHDETQPDLILRQNKISRKTSRSQYSRTYSKSSKTTYKSQIECNHLKVQPDNGICVNCNTYIPQYGSVLDNGTVKNFINIIYLEESKAPDVLRASRKGSVTSKIKQALPANKEHEDKITVPDRPESPVVNQQESYVVSQDNFQTIQTVLPYRDIRPNIAPKADIWQPPPQLIYESYTPENTLQMREYLLYITLRNLKRMRKYKLLSEAAFAKFQLPDDIKPTNFSTKNSIQTFKEKLKRSNRRLDPEYLRFDSTIESGNLDRVEIHPLNNNLLYIARANNQLVTQRYNLFCKVDTNTRGHQQWFYFRIKNTKKNTLYKFQIFNFTKPFSLFQQGMKVQLLSKKHQKLHVQNLEAQINKYREALAKKGETELEEPFALSQDAKRLMLDGLITEQWQPGGKKFEYVRSNQDRVNQSQTKKTDQEHQADKESNRPSTQHEVSEKQAPPPTTAAAEHVDQMRLRRSFYQLNFEIEFPYEDDTVYIAYSRPYPYSQIITHMFETEIKLEKGAANDDKQQEFFTHKITSKSIIYERRLLCRTISGLPVPSISITSPKSYAGTKKRIIFVTSRVHPGETNASTVFEGFLDKLTDQAENSSILQHFIVKLVPCMNPDGVVCGNYRSSLAGVDLNRQWILPSQELHPEVFFTKAMMQYLTKIEQRKILIYCDIHCHSKKKNSFLYGCNTAAHGAPFSTWTQVRLLPRLLARRSKFVSLPSCKFGIEACKLGTARVVVWKEFQVMNSFTLENSFYGYDHGPETRVYTQECYRQVGASLFLTFKDYRLCIAQIDKEMVELRGWLKPIKLKEITGTPAAEVISKEIRQKRIQAKKDQYIRSYQARLAIQSKGYNPEPKNESILTNKANQKDSKQSYDQPQTPLQKGRRGSDNSMLKQKKIPKRYSQSQLQETRDTNTTRKLAKVVNNLESAYSKSPYQANDYINTSCSHISDKGLVELAEEEASEHDQEGAQAKASERAGSDKGAEQASKLDFSADDDGPSEERYKVDLNAPRANYINLLDHNIQDGAKFSLQTLTQKANHISEDHGAQSHLVDAPQIVVRSLASLNQEERPDRTSSKIEILATRDHTTIQMPGNQIYIKPQQLDTESDQTLLAESEIERRNLEQDKRVEQSQKLMRSKFGDVQFTLQDSAHKYQSKDTPGAKKECWDKDVQIANFNVAVEHYSPPQEADNFNNWRQLFDQEELNDAYQYSLVGFKDLQDEEDKNKKQKNLKSKKKPDTEKFSENDDSADDDSVDDLNEFELHKQVYMQKESTITQTMRTTARAQSKFINEVKTMVQQQEANPEEISHQKDYFWDQVNAETKKNYHDPERNLSLEQRNVPQRKYKMPLSLAGIQMDKMTAPLERTHIRNLNQHVKGNVLSKTKPGYSLQNLGGATSLQNIEQVIQTQKIDRRNSLKQHQSIYSTNLAPLKYTKNDQEPFQGGNSSAGAQQNLDRGSTEAILKGAKMDLMNKGNRNTVQKQSLPQQSLKSIISSMSGDILIDSERGLQKIVLYPDSDHKQFSIKECRDKLAKQVKDTTHNIFSNLDTKNEYILQVQTAEKEKIDMKIDHLKASHVENLKRQRHNSNQPIYSDVNRPRRTIIKAPIQANRTDQMSQGSIIKDFILQIPANQMSNADTLSMPASCYRHQSSDRVGTEEQSHFQKNLPLNFIRGKQLKAQAIATTKSSHIQGRKKESQAELGQIQQVQSLLSRSSLAIDSQNGQLGSTLLHRGSIIIEDELSQQTKNEKEDCDSADSSGKQSQSPIRVTVTKRKKKADYPKVANFEIRARESESVFETDENSDAVFMSHRFAIGQPQSKLASVNHNTNNSSPKKKSKMDPIQKRTQVTSSAVRNTMKRRRAPSKQKDNQDTRKVGAYQTNSKTEAALPIIQQKINIPRSDGRNVGYNEDMQQVCRFSTVQLSVSGEQSLPKIMQSQITSAQMLQQLITEEDSSARTFMVTSQTSLDKPLKPVHTSSQSAGDKDDVNLSQISLNDLSRNKNPIILDTAKQSYSKEEKFKKKPSISQINISVTSNSTSNLQQQQLSHSPVFNDIEARFDSNQEYQFRQSEEQRKAQFCRNLRQGNRTEELKQIQIPSQANGNNLFRQFADEQRILMQSIPEDLKREPVQGLSRKGIPSEIRQIKSLLISDSSQNLLNQASVETDANEKKRRGPVDFQKYLAMSLDKVKNEQIRRTYVDQLEKNKTRAMTRRHQAPFSVQDSQKHVNSSPEIEHRQANATDIDISLQKHHHTTNRMQQNHTISRQKQLQTHVVTPDMYGLNSCALKIASRISDSRKSYQTSVYQGNQQQQYNSPVQSARYGDQTNLSTAKRKNSKQMRGAQKRSSLPNISQSIDNAKIKTATAQRKKVSQASTKSFRDIQEHEKQDFENVREYSAQNLGTYNEQNSLANINIIQVANSGIEQASQIQKTKRLKSQYAVEGIQSLQGRPPDILKIKKGRRMKIKSLLQKKQSINPDFFQ